MIYLKEFDSHSSYETELSVGGVDISLPNVSYCKDVKDVHYTPYNLVRFYVGEITGTTHQTVSIYTDISTSVDVQVSEGNKWYSCVLPKDKGLYRMEGDSVKKLVVKADISFEGISPFPMTLKHIIPSSTVEASFKSSNTSNITSMFAMFNYCSDLTSLDLSGWDTSNVTDMNNMFGDCRGLTSLDLSGWDTSNVTDMNSMFSYCDSLTSLDLSSFNTSNVINMVSMFNYCSSLTSLNISNFDTSNVTLMNGMFYGCSGLTSLDLSGWDTSKVTNMTNMFKGCGSLKTIKMVRCSPETIQKITDVKPSGATIITGQTI